MNAVTKQEIVSLIEGLIESDACMGSISDKQVVMALEVVSRIKQHGIAPPDGFCIAPNKPTKAMRVAAEKSCWYDKENDRLFPCAVYHAMLAAAPEVKP